MIRTYPEILEDDSPVVDGSAVSKLWKLRKRDRTMAHERRNKEGQRYNLDHFDDGINKVYLYRLPRVLEVEKERGRQSTSITTSDRQPSSRG